MFKLVSEAGPQLMSGLWITMKLTAYSTALGLICALASGAMLLSPTWAVRSISRVYVEIFRGTSALVQLFFFYYVLPLLGVNLNAMLAATLALGLNIGAYGSEVVRSAVRSVDPGQWEAAIAINLSVWRTWSRIILPQAALLMIPSLGTLLIVLFKATALASLVTVNELTFSANQFVMTSGSPQNVFLLVLVMYFIVAFIMAKCVRGVEGRLRRRWHLIGGLG